MVMVKWELKIARTRGFAQRNGEDYDETLAPVTKHETIEFC